MKSHISKIVKAVKRYLRFTRFSPNSGPVEVAKTQLEAMEAPMVSNGAFVACERSVPLRMNGTFVQSKRRMPLEINGVCH